MYRASDRAAVLLGQGRPDLAESELRVALSEDPHDAHAHALLSLCLSDLDRPKDATAEAEQAVALAPDASLGHYAHAAALLRRSRLTEARAAIAEAIRIEPDDPNHLALLGQIHLDRRQWTEALGAADRGLESDPEHVGCTNVRALALTKLGRDGDARDALGDALARDPEDALTHTNTGWALLHRGEIAGATEHFQEALRLQPDLEWAREGLLHALKARSRIYRAMLRFFVWTSRLSEGRVWMLLLAIVLVPRIFNSISKVRPDLAPYLVPPTVALIAFVYLTWTAEHIYNVVLFFHPIGRHALTRRERVGAAAVAVCLALAVGGLLASWWLELDDGLLASLMCLLYVIPLSAALRAPEGRARQVLGGIALCVGALGLVSIAGLLFAAPEGAFEAVANIAFLAFFIGAVGTSWLANFMVLRGVKN